MMSGSIWRTRRARKRLYVSVTWTRITAAPGSMRRPSATVSTCRDRHHRPAGRRECHRGTGEQGGTECGDPLLSSRRKTRSGAVPQDCTAHRVVENSLRRVLDVAMGEDSLRNCRDNGPENLALKLAQATPTAIKQSMRGKLKRAR